VQLASEHTYDQVRDAIVDLGLPLNRLEQRRHRLEELFRDESAVAASAVATSAQGAEDVR